MRLLLCGGEIVRSIDVDVVPNEHARDILQTWRISRVLDEPCHCERPG